MSADASRPAAPEPSADTRGAAAVPASRIIGANPKGELRTVSLALKRALEPLGTGTPLLVGLSGGADSLALALAAIDWGARTGRAVHTLTVDHGLRPESAAEAEGVAEQARALGAHADIERVELSKNGGPEAAAREARRAALARRALELGAPVLLGHTLDDQAETVLLRLARGSGARSLRAIRPELLDSEGVHWIRPLLSVRRETTRGACAQAGLEWVTDPTNDPDGPWRAADGGALRRSAVRARALPALARALGVDPIPALARSAELAARDDDALSQWARREWDAVRRDAELPDGTSRPALDAERTAALPQAIRTRLIRRLSLEGGARPGALSSRLIDEADALLLRWHGQKGVDLPGARILRLRDAGGRPVLLVEETRRGGARSR